MKGFDKDMTKETPANIGQLVKDANNKSSWKIRLAALNELKERDSDFNNFIIGKSIRMPIPQSEVDNNPNLNQNDQY